MGVGRAVATNCSAPNVARHAAAANEDLDRARTDADIGPLAHELEWNAVVVAVDLEVIVDADHGPLPGGELVGPRRERAESWSIDRLKDAAPAPFELAEGPVVEPFEPFPNGGIGLGETEERPVAQRREDPTLGDLDADFGGPDLLCGEGWLCLASCGSRTKGLALGQFRTPHRTRRPTPERPQEEAAPPLVRRPQSCCARPLV